MTIKFVEAVPEIFEYPSEASLMDEVQPATKDTSPGNIVPSLSGM